MLIHVCNAVVKMPRNCCERTLNIALITYFRNGTFEKKYHNSDESRSHPVVLLTLVLKKL